MHNSRPYRSTWIVVAFPSLLVLITMDLNMVFPLLFTGAIIPRRHQRRSLRSWLTIASANRVIVFSSSA